MYRFYPHTIPQFLIVKFQLFFLHPPTSCCFKPHAANKNRPCSPETPIGKWSCQTRLENPPIRFRDFPATIAGGNPSVLLLKHHILCRVLWHTHVWSCLPLEPTFLGHVQPSKHPTFPWFSGNKKQEASKKDVPIRLETGQKAGVRPSRVVNLHVGTGLEELRWLLEDLIYGLRRWLWESYRYVM